jgi:hypothetical protein
MFSLDREPIEELGDPVPTILEQVRERPDDWDTYVELAIQDAGYLVDDAEDD